MKPEAADAIAEKFVTARRFAQPLPVYPGAQPAVLESAYGIQDAAIARFPAAIGGWKVGRIWPPQSEQLGSQRLAGPIFVDAIQRANGRPVVGRIFEGGFGAAEAEFLLCVGKNADPAKADYTLDEAAAMIASVHVGIEIASSPFPGINVLGPLVTISDFGNNNGVVIGAEVPDWQNSGFADWDVSLSIDGVEVGTGRAAAFPDGPIGSVRFLLENLAMRGIAVPQGTWISTGAITGVHEVCAGQRVEAHFGDRYSVDCTIEAATAR